MDLSSLQKVSLHMMFKGRCLLDTCLTFVCLWLTLPDLHLPSVWPWEDRCLGECDPGSGEGTLNMCQASHNIGSNHCRQTCLGRH